MRGAFSKRTLVAGQLLPYTSEPHFLPLNLVYVKRAHKSHLEVPFSEATFNYRVQFSLVIIDFIYLFLI